MKVIFCPYMTNRAHNAFPLLSLSHDFWQGLYLLMDPGFANHWILELNIHFQNRLIVNLLTKYDHLLFPTQQCQTYILNDCWNPHEKNAKHHTIRNKRWQVIIPQDWNRWCSICKRLSRKILFKYDEKDAKSKYLGVILTSF